MSAASRLRSWWKVLLHRSSFEHDMETELHTHLENYADDLMRRGMDRESAIRWARLELGTVAAQKESCRRSLGLRPLDDFIGDLRYVFRQLRRAPAFTVTVLVVLALGIGANAAMFSIIDATLLRWLPYHKPNQLVSLYLADSNGDPSWAFYQEIKEWQKQSHSLESVAYYIPVEGYLGTDAGQASVSALSVSANLFSVLGVQPVLGRSFLESEQQSGNANVIIVSHEVWRTLLRADQEVIGKQVRVNDRPYTVVGVMPERFLFPANDKDPQVWIPAELTPAHLKPVTDFTAPVYQAIGRLPKGASPSTVDAELSGIESRLVPWYPADIQIGRKSSRVDAAPYRETLVKESRPALLALIAVVAIMWLIACANIANLMLARGMARQREIAVRGALGASHSRIVRQLFTESLVLSLLGAIAGLALAQLALRIFDKVLSARLKLPGHLTPNAGVLGALLILSILSAIVFGLLPAWLAARTSIDDSLRHGTAQAGTGKRRHKLQQAMVVAEVGLSLVLLIACGLLLRTVFALRKVPLGFRTDHVLMVHPELPRYKYRNVDTNHAIFQPLLQRVRQLPGAQSAAITTLLPLHKGFTAILTLDVKVGEKSSGVPLHIDAQLKAAGPELQQILGFQMARGRFFNQQDTPDSQPVAVVNRAFAQRYLPAGDVMEKFSINLGKKRAARIIGVMDDFHQTSIDQPSFPEIDFCAPQLLPTDGFYQPILLAHVELAIRTQTDPQQFVPALRRAIAEINPDLQASSIETMDQIVEDSMGSQLLAAHLLELFGATALLIALAGLYGLLTYLVSQRTRELSVRLALGAQRTHILTMLLEQAGRMLVAGAAIGLTMAWFSGRLIAGFLYGVAPHDPGTMVAVTALLLLCGVIASYLPARTASRVDPMEALRRE